MRRLMVVVEKRLAEPHIDVVFKAAGRGQEIHMRFGVGQEARFAQELRLGERVEFCIERTGDV